MNLTKKNCCLIQFCRIRLGERNRMWRRSFERISRLALLENQSSFYRLCINFDVVNFPDSRENIMKVAFLWILPLWIISFLVASRVVKRPIISAFLDDLLM
uniref:Uncharacterized protein n=1 Tax=Lactuca sativa TaxID=4236 RepID=A0A9R1VQE9_LACSA|nr:hypothetical protein LSAT_V11C400201600 [Lactuca sativa]